MPSSSQSLSSMGTIANSMADLSMSQRPAMSASNSFSLPPPPGANSFGQAPSPGYGQAKPAQKSGLDAFESLL